MRMLALETSSPAASVAILEDGQLLGETAFDPQQRTAQAFAPAIAKQLAEAGWRPRDLELIAVTVGPGSFTGLRIGVTAAKTLAYATGAQLIGLNTLHVIAAQSPTGMTEVCATLNAQRQQLFAATYRCRDLLWEAVRPTAIVDNSAWLQSLAPGVVVTGPALARLRQQLPGGVVVVEETCWLPRAATVGRLGYLTFQAGTRDDLWKLSPQYFRKSAAEEVWESKPPTALGATVHVGGKDD
jgi:tRNA threonylcarbamoyladenosine biosynthesis protein TsaB